MKKILIITSGLLPLPAYYGGAVENLTEMLLEANSNLKEIEFTAYSILPNKNTNKYEIENCEFRYINNKTLLYKIKKVIYGIKNRSTSKRTGNAYINLILKDIKKRKELEKYDLVLIENVPYYVLPICKYFKNKIILHVHNDWLNTNTQLAEEIIENCKSIYCVSNYVKKQVQKVSNTSKCKVIINGIDTKKFKRDDNILELYKNDLIFLYVGKINKQKGTDILLEAFLEFSKNKKNVKLIMVGGTFNKNNKNYNFMNNLIKKAKENENIIIKGYIDYNEISKIYSLADIQIVPSQIEESCPLVVIEGLSMGNAMIVSDSGGINEIVDEKCSYIVKRGINFKNDIIKYMEILYNDKNKLEEMKNLALERSKLFSKEIYTDTFIKNLMGE